MATTLMMPGNNRPQVHPFFKLKNRPPSPDPEVDLREGCRKRRRRDLPDSEQTDPVQNTTPITTDAWADQLKAAAYGTSSTINSTSATLPGHDSEIVQQYQSIDHDEGASISKNGPGSDHSLLQGQEAPESEDVRSPLAARQKKHTTPSPPKKVLRIRPDGRLRSPKPQDPPKPRGRKKASKTEAPEKNSLIITISYGTDRESCKVVGQMIDSTMLGLGIIPGFGTSIISKASEHPGPLKPTHPFFLGDGIHSPTRQTATPKNNMVRAVKDSEFHAQRGKTVRPRESRVTSKPARTEEAPASPPNLYFPASSCDHTNLSRFSGTREPIWPPEDMLHIGRQSETSLIVDDPHGRCLMPRGLRKLKDIQLQITAEEEVLKPYTDLTSRHRNDASLVSTITSRDGREFRRPVRMTMSGHELQRVIRSNVMCKVRVPGLQSNYNGKDDGLSSSQPFQKPAHSAVSEVFNRIADSSTAFDKFRCETQDWVHKYAPKCAANVLQDGREVEILRDWLRRLTVSSVDFRGKTARSRDSSLVPRGVKRKKRGRAEELDDFVVSSDEDANQTDYTLDSGDIDPLSSAAKRSVLRAGESAGSLNYSDRASNAVVISGPHGCGKTAAVYAVAEELGFEVFEINAGSRRSGKDVLDKVGDVARNHLLKRGRGKEPEEANEIAEDLKQLDEKLQEEIESGRQGTMKSFFQPKGESKKKQAESRAKPKKSSSEKSSPKKELPKKQQIQKQSLILLEEVDVLFEEDKTFWATTVDLIMKSKRPVIMTCTEERLIPLEEMTLYAILRFAPASEQLATDYLLLVACSEGHILLREAVSALYKVKRHDLRASLSELNLFCQMAIGDRKGGLEWMLLNPPSTDLGNPQEKKLRVVSGGTYYNGIGWLGGDERTLQVSSSLGQATNVLLKASEAFGIDIGFLEDIFIAERMQRTDEPLRKSAFDVLQDIEQMYEALSAADTLPASNLRQFDKMILDPTQADFTAKSRCNYVEGSTLLHADPLIDPAGISSDVALTLKVCSMRLLQSHSYDAGRCPLTEQSILHNLPRILEAVEQSSTPVTKFTISRAFDPISRYTFPQIASFDAPLSAITTDLAPYIRSIVSYDQRLEEQRRQLSSLLSQPGKEGTRIRKTRASRAALEGGSKANTRRERWFPDSTNFKDVLRTGGQSWGDVVIQQAENEVGQQGE